MPRWSLGLLLLPALAFADALTLERAVELALSRNERAQAAEQQVEAAGGRLTQARAFFFPSLTATGTYNRRAFEVVRDVGGVSVAVQQLNALNGNATLRWTLFDARGIPLYRAAGADARATKLESAESRRRLAFEAAEAFLQLLALDNVEDAARRRIELAQRNVAEARARKDAGLASSNDVTRAELEAATAARELARAEGDVRSARLHLGWLLDVEPAKCATLAPPQKLLDEAATAGPTTQRPDDAAARIEARLDVKALQERAFLQDQLALEPWMRLLPSIGLTGQVRATNETGLSGRTVDGYVGVDLTWVLFDGGARYGAMAEKKAQARIAALNARLTKRTAAREVEDALVAVATSRASAAQAQVAEAAAKRNSAETSELYHQGLTTGLQLADASQQQFEAEVALVRERYAVVMALLDLRAALGVDPLGREVEQ